MSKIQIEGEFHDFGDEKDYHIITVDEDDLLDQIDGKLIARHARDYLYMVSEDEAECSLDKFDEDGIVKHLKKRGFDFMEEVEDQDMIHYLESNGCIVTDKNEDSIDSYDYVDSCLFEEISTVFDSLSCQKRQELRDLIINFK